MPLAASAKYPTRARALETYWSKMSRIFSNLVGQMSSDVSSILSNAPSVDEGVGDVFDQDVEQ